MSSWPCGIISVSYAIGCWLETQRTQFTRKFVTEFNEFAEFSESHLGKTQLNLRHLFLRDKDVRTVEERQR